MEHKYWPMLAKSKDKIFDDKNWLFEPKLDGIRAIAYIDKNSRATIFNRSGANVTHRFPELQFETKSPCVLDGEIVCFDNTTAIPDFQRMQTRMHRENDIPTYVEKYPATYVAFDLLEVCGKCITDYKLQTRKELLDEVMHLTCIHRTNDQLLLTYPLRYEIENGTNLFNQLVGWEGVMAKRLNSFYMPGMRSVNWLKIKPRKTVEVYCVGCTPGKGRRANTFGAIVIAEKTETGFKYVGDVGTGYTDEQADKLLHDIMIRIATKSVLPFYIHPSVLWCDPFPISVSYIEKTNSGLMRLPSFEGFR